MELRKAMESESNNGCTTCPVCNKEFKKEVIHEHVNKCLFLNTSEQMFPASEHSTSNNKKRNSTHLKTIISPNEKKMKIECNSTSNPKVKEPQALKLNPSLDTGKDRGIPLAERMRPLNLDDIVGQTEAFGHGSMLRSMLEQKKIPNMILWGPPGCGKLFSNITQPAFLHYPSAHIYSLMGVHIAQYLKYYIWPEVLTLGQQVGGSCSELMNETFVSRRYYMQTSIANVVANICKEQNNMRFVKLSATMSGINDVKEIVKVAKNEMQFKRQTVLFMDEIHRFNKLQQDTFLPHVENGTITLIGATTENPSFSLNNALLSRCRVVVMQKLSVDEVLLILRRALVDRQILVLDSKRREKEDDMIPRFIVEENSLRWLAEVSDGDARVALGALELTLASRDLGNEVHVSGPVVLALEDIKNGIKRSHMLYDRQGEEHYNTVSAIHKAIRASDDNAALYWTTRALHGGEDPIYIARRLIRTACEDIGLADRTALVDAVACLQGCQQIGMPECDVLLVQCAVRLARAPKSRDVYNAMKRCQRSLKEVKGPLPPVPLHLRNAPTKLMKQIGYGTGYNLLHKSVSGLEYMPEGMEDINFFHNTDTDEEN